MVSQASPSGQSSLVPQTGPGEQTPHPAPSGVHDSPAPHSRSDVHSQGWGSSKATGSSSKQPAGTVAVVTQAMAMAMVLAALAMVVAHR